MPRQVGRWGPSPFSASSIPNTSIVAKRTIAKKLLVFAVIGLLYLLRGSDSFAEQVREETLSSKRRGQKKSIAIQKATHSQYSHMGIVFLRNGSPHVYEAIKTVQYTPLRKWVDRAKTATTW